MSVYLFCSYALQSNTQMELVFVKFSLNYLFYIQQNVCRVLKDYYDVQQNLQCVV